jgi:hypothetical protein
MAFLLDQTKKRFHPRARRVKIKYIMFCNEMLAFGKTDTRGAVHYLEMLAAYQRSFVKQNRIYRNAR